MGFQRKTVRVFSVGLYICRLDIVFGLLIGQNKAYVDVTMAVEMLGFVLHSNYLSII